MEPEMNTPIRLEALLEKFELQQVFSDHLKKDHKSAKEEGDVVGVVYVEFGQPVNAPDEKNRPVLSALSPEYFLSRTVDVEGGKVFVGFYTTRDVASAHGELNQRAMGIRTGLVESNVSPPASVSFLAKSGELPVVLQYAKALAEKSKTEGTHWHEYQ